MSSVHTKPRLLVGDDVEDIRALLRLSLERGGYEVDEQPDGRSALRAFHTGRHDLVILDVTMPDLDGWEILDRIRDLSEVPVLMLTARDSEVDRVRGLRAGADDYVAKPFDRDELLARVEVLLRRAPREEEPVSYGDSFLHVDFVQRAVSVEWRVVSLGTTEDAASGRAARGPAAQRCVSPSPPTSSSADRSTQSNRPVPLSASPSAVLTAASSLSLSIGFSTYARAPAAEARSSVADGSRALTITTGMCASAGDVCNRSMTTTPSPPRRPKSSRIK